MHGDFVCECKRVVGRGSESVNTNVHVENLHAHTHEHKHFHKFGLILAVFGGFCFFGFGLFMVYMIERWKKTDAAFITFILIL